MLRRLTLAFPFALVLLTAACGDDAPTGPDPVTDPAAATYAPELGVDIGAMTKTQSGLYLQDLAPGTGATVQTGQLIDAHYTGWLTNGQKFDSSRDRGVPLCFTVGGNVINGWNEGVPGMRVGGKRKLVIPPQLGYGASGSEEGGIPPNAILVFDVEVVGIREGTAAQYPQGECIP